MNPRSALLIPALVSGFFLSSCSVLKSAYYAGKIEPVSEEVLAEESIWLCNNEAYYLRRDESNSFIAATLEWDTKGGTYVVKSFPVVWTSLDDHTFLNIKEGALYTILRAAVLGNDTSSEGLALFTVDKNRMQQAIESGSVKARIDGHHVILEGSKQEQDEYIKNNLRSVFSMDPTTTARLLLEKKKQPPEEHETP